MVTLINPGNILKTLENIHEKVDKGSIPIVLGGDHSVSIPVVEAF
jgi:arginase family enzyme